MFRELGGNTYGGIASDNILEFLKIVNGTENLRPERKNSKVMKVQDFVNENQYIDENLNLLLS